MLNEAMYGSVTIDIGFGMESLTTRLSSPAAAQTSPRRRVTTRAVAHVSYGPRDGYTMADARIARSA